VAIPSVFRLATMEAVAATQAAMVAAATDAAGEVGQGMVAEACVDVGAAVAAEMDLAVEEAEIWVAVAVEMDVGGL